MAEHPVVIVGAGASMPYQAPGLRGLLPEAITSHKAALSELDQFLEVHFRSVEPDRHYPELPVVLGMLDTALDRKQELGPTWGLDRLRSVRTQAEYAIYLGLQQLDENVSLYDDLVDWLAGVDGEPTIISLNYDLLVDAALIEIGQKRHGNVRFPDYGCDIATDAYRQQGKFGRLFKPVGSLHWLHCPACQRLDAAFYSANAMPSGVRRAFDAAMLGEAYTGRTYKCRRAHCGAVMNPVIVTPTPLQEKHISHIGRVRYGAEKALQQADLAIFIGYSMRLSDLDLIYLLQRGLAHLPPERIVVVARDDGWVYQNYVNVFGPRIRWEPLDFDSWLKQVKGHPGIPVGNF